jgi:hypothetical protein
MYRFPPNGGWSNGAIPDWYMRMYNGPKPPLSPIHNDIPICAPLPPDPVCLPHQPPARPRGQHPPLNHPQQTAPNVRSYTTPSMNNIQPQETSSQEVSPTNQPPTFPASMESSSDHLLHLLRDLTVQDLLYNIARDNSMHNPTPSGTDAPSVLLPLPQLQNYPPAIDAQPAPGVPQPGVLPTQSGSFNCTPPTVTPSWLTSESKFQSKATSAPYQEHYSGSSRTPIQPPTPIPPLPPPFAPPPPLPPPFAPPSHFHLFPLNPISRPTSQPSTSTSDTISNISADGLENVDWNAWGTPPNCWSALFDLNTPARGNLR